MCSGSRFTCECVDRAGQDGQVHLSLFFQGAHHAAIGQDRHASAAAAAVAKSVHGDFCLSASPPAWEVRVRATMQPCGVRGEEQDRKPHAGQELKHNAMNTTAARATCTFVADPCPRRGEGFIRAVPLEGDRRRKS